MIPSATPTRLAPEERAAVDAAIRRVLDDGPWVGGSEVEAFEQELATELSLRSVVGCANGTDALALALGGLGGLGLEPGARVLVPGHDGGYSATAARMAGFVPVVVDIDPVTAHPSVATLERAGDASALIVVHLHGDPVPLSEIDAWRRARGLLLVEDCAQAAGVAVGTTGDAATFSFYPTKNLGAAGDAGAVAFRDADAAARARALAQYGWGDRYDIVLPGGRNSRLDPIQAAVLRARLPFLRARNQRRQEVRAAYVAAAPQLAFLGDASGVAHHAVVRSEHRDRLADHLTARGIATAVHYPVAVADMTGADVAGGPTPVARRLASEILSVPCTPELTDDEVDAVAAALTAWEEPA